jgi:hypothetical protein
MCSDANCFKNGEGAPASVMNTTLTSHLHGVYRHLFRLLRRWVEFTGAPLLMMAQNLQSAID